MNTASVHFLLALLLALQLLAGCGAIPERLDSPPALELIHPEFVSARVDSESGKIGRVHSPWWTSIGGDVLGDLLYDVAENNHALSASEFRAAAASYRALVQASRRSPDIGLDSSASGISTRERSSLLGPTSGESSSEQYTLGVGIRWELDLWGRLARVSEAADADARASKLDADALQLSVTEDAARQWVFHASATEQIALIGQQKKSVQTQIDVLTTRQRLGEPVLSQILQLRSIAASLEQDHQLLTLEREQAGFRLAQLRGVSMDTPLLDQPILSTGLTWESVLGTPKDLLDTRPDLQAAMERLRAADARMHAAFLDRWPRIEISASAAFSSARLADLFLGELLQAAASLSAPLYNGGRSDAIEGDALALRDAAAADLADTVLSTLAEVEGSIAGVHRRQGAEEAAILSVTHARSAYEESRSRFIGAGGSALDALIAEERLLQAQRDAAEARKQRALAIVSLGIALGQHPFPSSSSDNEDL